MDRGERGRGGGGGGMLYFTSCDSQSIYFASLKLTILPMDTKIHFFWCGNIKEMAHISHRVMDRKEGGGGGGRG